MMNEKLPKSQTVKTDNPPSGMTLSRASDEKPPVSSLHTPISPLSPQSSVLSPLPSVLTPQHSALSTQHSPPPAGFFEPSDLPSPVDYEALFGARAPVEIEVGCGNGRYLRRAACERPGHLFIGIERSLSYARKAQDRMVKYGVGNVRIVRADASCFLAERIAPESVHALHVYFTDPWPKNRHAKRRLFQTPFLETIHRILRPGGQVFIKVDLYWYFEEIFCRFEQSPWFTVAACGMETDPDRDLYEITGFEHKALVKKGAVFTLAVERSAEC